LTRLTGADQRSAPVTGLIHLFTGTQVQWLLIRMGRVPQPTQAQVHTFTSLTWGLLVLDALLGVAVLRGRWREALALERVQPGPGPSP
jgi:protease PrsW